MPIDVQRLLPKFDLICSHESLSEHEESLAIVSILNYFNFLYFYPTFLRLFLTTCPSFFCIFLLLLLVIEQMFLYSELRTQVYICYVNIAKLVS